MYSFSNSVLILVFNDSNNVSNKNVLKELYKRHFKKIIFYSVYPIVQDEEVHFIDINNGYNTCKIFNHFHTNYRSILEDCDGLFYTMDNTIINVNILHLFDSNKIIYCSANTENIDVNSILEGNDHNNAVNNLINDVEFKTFNIDKFSDYFSCFFYLPKKYLTDSLFKLFELFSKYEVFLNIAISSIIQNIEMDTSQYQHFKSDICNNSDFLNKEYIYNSFNHDHNFILHPIKNESRELIHLYAHSAFF
jgi:hypothetical protein